MAQLAVYKNKNARTKSTFPYLVDVQSDLLESLHTRVVVPLMRAAALTKKPVSHLTPVINFDGEPYLLMTPQLAGIARSELGAEAGALTDQRQTILGAIDFLLTGFSVQPRELKRPLQGLILLILAPFREASPIRPFSPKTKTNTGLCRVSTS